MSYEEGFSASEGYEMESTAVGIASEGYEMGPPDPNEHSSDDDVDDDFDCDCDCWDACQKKVNNFVITIILIMLGCFTLLITIVTCIALWTSLKGDTLYSTTSKDKNCSCSC